MINLFFLLMLSNPKYLFLVCEFRQNFNAGSVVQFKLCRLWIDRLLLTRACGNLVFVSIFAGDQGLNSQYVLVLNSIPLLWHFLPIDTGVCVKAKEF